MPTSGTPGTSRPRPRTIAFLFLAVALLVLFVGIFAYQGGASQGRTGGERPAGSAKSDSAPLDLSRRLANDPSAIGDAGAPVVLIEYADYRCPFCGLFARDTLPALVEKYVASGDLRIEWRDLPVFGDESNKAAVAGRAAGKQGKFWEFNKAVFAIAPERGHAALPRERLLQIAKDAGVPDISQFEADLDSKELEQAVIEDAQEAASIGATGTPTFLVNESPLVGAQPLATFEKAIEEALRKAEAK